MRFLKRRLGKVGDEGGVEILNMVLWRPHTYLYAQSKSYHRPDGGMAGLHHGTVCAHTCFCVEYCQQVRMVYRGHARVVTLSAYTADLSWAQLLLHQLMLASLE